MDTSRRFIAVLLVCVLLLSSVPLRASAYNGQPKLVVVIIIDQFRGDYIDRGLDQFGEGGFRLFTDHGAWFTNCNYQYANTRTAPGHATLFTGAYSNGHGIWDNEVWVDSLQRMVTSVEDDQTQLVGIPGNEKGASPHNLLSDTIGDELRLATDGKSRVFTISLKDRASVLPGGFSGTAFWIDHMQGGWITSSYYMKELPAWVQKFNDAQNTDKYWNRSWKAGGRELRNTNKPATLTGKQNFYEIVGATPFANDYEFEFAKELIAQEKLGQGPATDFLSISLSANDILGHKAGPNSEESRAMAQAIDRQLAGFFQYLGNQVGLGNVWIALSADHGVSNAPSYIGELHIPGGYGGQYKFRNTLNEQLRAKLLKTSRSEVNFVPSVDWPLVMLNSRAFIDAGVKEADAEQMVAEFFKPYSRGYYTRTQIAANHVPPTQVGKKFVHSLSPESGWFVFLLSPPFTVGGSSGTDHVTPYSYDTHVPVAFYGLPFQPGVYRGACEPVDLSVTLANLLGINSPSAAVGRVLTEALKSKQ